MTVDRPLDSEEHLCADLFAKRTKAAVDLRPGSFWRNKVSVDDRCERMGRPILG